MFLRSSSVLYDTDGQQYASGLFLILVSPKGASMWYGNYLRAVVRPVAMHQLGPWMMGQATVAGCVLCLSGSYGHDGLPVDAPNAVYNAAIGLPNHLFYEWVEGGGHNGAGIEAPLMRAWALEHLQQLCTAGTTRRRVLLRHA